MGVFVVVSASELAKARSWKITDVVGAPPPSPAQLTEAEAAFHRRVAAARQAYQQLQRLRQLAQDAAAGRTRWQSAGRK